MGPEGIWQTTTGLVDGDEAEEIEAEEAGRGGERTGLMVAMGIGASP